MKTPRRTSARWTLAASACMLLLALAFILQPPGRHLTAGEAPAGAPTTTIVNVGDTEPVVTTAPPAENLPAAIIESSPTAATYEGGAVPIDTEVAPLREMDETAPINIFADPNVVAKLLIPRKPFLYDAKGRRDPMIIEWLRIEKVNEELMAQAQTYIAEAGQTTDPEARRARYLLAIQELDRVIKTDPTSQQGKQAQSLKDKVRKLIEDTTAAGVKSAVVTKPPELPPWIPANTRAVVLDESPQHRHIVLVGDDMLRAGDTVPKYADVKIIEINRNAVVYEYKGIRVTVSVDVPVARE